MKNFLMHASFRNIFENFYGVITKYSHRKLRLLSRYRCFKMVFEKFLTTGSLDKMISDDPTLNRNADKFKESAKILMTMD